MNTKFKDVANLYLPFLAIVDDRSYMVHGYSIDEDMFQIDIDKQDSDWWNTDNFKPVLKRLSDLSELDLVFLMREKFQYENFINFRIENGSITEPPAIYCTGLKKINDRLIETYCTQHISSLNPVQFKFLINAGVDLFGLIESKEAVDVKSLTSGYCRWQGN